VTVHCTTATAIANTVDAGADGIEHGTFGAPDRAYRLDPPIAERLARAGTTVTTTLQVYRDLAEITTGPDNDVWRQRSETARESMWRLYQLGAPLIGGLRRWH
jgi:hypothetical protein